MVIKVEVEEDLGVVGASFSNKDEYMMHFFGK